MRSNDKQVIHPDNAPLKDSGELDLPDDLLELAAQLGDDARHLASTYPGSLAGQPVVRETASAVDARFEASTALAISQTSEHPSPLHTSLHRLAALPTKRMRRRLPNKVELQNDGPLLV